MRFARIVFTIAGVYGLLVLTPMYFTFDVVGRHTPPAITHAEFYYGFVGLAVVWQVAFLMIASDPARLRLMMIPSVLEKATWFVAVVVLYFQHRIGLRMLTSAMADAILGVLFIAAFLRTRPAPAKRQEVGAPTIRRA
jgi:hypothetical protein